MTLPPILKTKAFLYTTGGLLLALAVTIGLLVVQTNRLSASNTALKATEESLSLATEVANQRATELAGRDRTIQAQTDSIDALAAAKGASRVIYQQGIQQADEQARTHEEVAAGLVKAPAVAPTDYCEAARSLIEQEMLNVR